MMKTITEWLHDRCSTGLLQQNEHHIDTPLDILRLTEWSSEFERYMRNRLLMGAFHYGRLGKKPGYDNIGSALKRLKLYQETGNQEHLVDVANLCLVEFVDGQHPNRHFVAQDDSEHVEPIEVRQR